MADADVDAPRAPAAPDADAGSGVAPKAAKPGDAPTNSVFLLVSVVAAFCLVVGAVVLVGLSARCRLGQSCDRLDLSENRYDYRNLPFRLPFPYIFAALASGLFGITVLASYAFDLLRKDVGTPLMVEIASYIAEGSIAFLRTEYLTLIPLAVVFFILIGFAQNWAMAGAYLIGAGLSALTGYIGMSIATRGNCRTTAASMLGLGPGLNVAFRAGAVMGLSVVSVGLAGLSFTYLVFRDIRSLAGFSFGASTIALFARVGGGIYTKAADVGADLVGKVEANIPEDDPRNPATIADNVGDNVGDVAGMGSDLFESFVGSIVATAILGSSLPYFADNALALCIHNHLHLDEQCISQNADGSQRFFAAIVCDQDFVDQYPSLSIWQSNALFVALPFMVALVGILVSVLCTAYIHVSKKLATETDKAKIMESLLGSLRINIYLAGALVIVGSAGLCWGFFGSRSEFQDAAGFGNANLPHKVYESCAIEDGKLAPTGTQELTEYRPQDPLGFQYPAPDSIPWRLFVCILVGLVLGNLIGGLTEYFTAGSYSPTQGIGGAGEYGAGAVVIQGLGVGMLSTSIPLALVATTIVGTYNLFGAYGISLAAVGMLSTLGVTMATDAYGPVADNAGGIAEMAELDSSVRDTTDALDALGNTTAATGKGFSNGSAVLTAFSILVALVQDSGLGPSPQELVPATVGGFVSVAGGPLKTIRDYSVISLVDPYVVFGILVGVALPYAFGAFTMLAVSRAAQAMIVEVRRQFREIPGLREGRDGVRPEHILCIDISTRAALFEMVLPGSLAILAPLIVGFGFGQKALVGLLLAGIASGYMLGILLSNAGGAWDNAKKLVESGYYGKGNGKGSEWHKATVAGDTVGDPAKDTSGPSMNILIKLMSTLGLVSVGLMEVDRTNGWIGAIVLGCSLFFMAAFWLWYARKVSKIRAEASKRAEEFVSLVDEGVDSA